MADFPAFKHWLSDKKIGLHHRQLLIIELPSEKVQRFIDEVSKHFAKLTEITNGRSAFFGTQTIPMARYQDHLGTQTDVFIFNASKGIHLNAMYAGAGMVQSAGLVIIVLDPCQLYNHDNANIKFSLGFKPTSCYFTDIFKKRSCNFNAAYLCDTTTLLPSVKIESASTKEQETVSQQLGQNENAPNINANKSHQALLQTMNDVGFSETQRNIAFEITKRIFSITNNENTVSVILGARGRGKSSLLGAIAATLKNRANSSGASYKVICTSLNKQQLNAFYSSYGNFNNCSNELTFFSLDEVVNLAPKNAVVLIDEVSSIAPELLKSIINNFPHTVVTGTSSGYEGSGNGFLKRVLPNIQSFNNTYIYELQTPFRWFTGDPVEAFFTDLLGSKIEPYHGKIQSSPANIDKVITTRLLDKSELINNDLLYDEIFSLLNQAHYQTTPNDIVRTLDASEAKIFISQTEKDIDGNLEPKVIAVAVTFDEGGEILSSLAKDISVGKRRVQGHMSPQALSLLLFESNVCRNRFLRINRIAVHDKFSRLGIASKLLQHCEQFACKDGADYMSVSFGFNQGLFSFWQKNSYLLSKIGQRIDTASGSPSVLMIKPISSCGDIDQQSLNYRVKLDLNYCSSFSQKLNTTFSYLKNEVFVSTFQYQDKDKFLRKRLQMYLNSEISFLKFAPMLLELLNKDESISAEQSKVLFDIFIKLHEKGLHKIQKKELEDSLLKKLKNLNLC